MDRKDKIKYFEKRKRELNKELDESQDLKRIQEIGEELEMISNKLMELKNNLDSALNTETSPNDKNPSPDDENPTSEEVKRSNQWVKIDNSKSYMLNDKNFRNVGSFGGNASNSMNDKIYLRKHEAFSSRFKTEPSEDNLSFRALLKGIGTGVWEQNEKRAISTDNWGSIIPTGVSAKVIEGAFNKSLFLDSDIPIVPMENGNITIPRVKTSSLVKPSQKEEYAVGQELDVDLEPVNLSAKTVYGYCTISNELLLKSDPSAETILRETFSKAIAEALDRACLYTEKETNGTPKAYAIKGVWNDQDINSLEVGSTDTIDYDDVIDGIAKVESQNYLVTNIAMNSENKKELAKMKNTIGDYIKAPQDYEALNKTMTNQLEKDNLLVYNSNALALGLMSNLIVKKAEGTEDLKRNTTTFSFAIYADLAITMPKGICKIYKTSPSA